MTMVENNWFDAVGDEWERAGVKSGNIFEFHFPLNEDTLPGGLVETVCQEGMVPKNPEDIKRVLVRLKDGTPVEMPWNRPLVLVNYRKLTDNMC